MATITFDQIVKELNVFDTPAIKLIQVKYNKDGIIVREEIGVQFYCPFERRQICLAHIRRIFAGTHGLIINYLYEMEMIDIRYARVPEVVKTFNAINN